jgi:hypothetical protein
MSKLAITTIRKIIRHHLVSDKLQESDAYQRKFGKRFDPSDKIKPYVDQFSSDGIAKYAITMTTLNKVGVNPTSEYQTPFGIYLYPLTSEIYSDLLKNTLPFASEQPSVSIVRLINPTKSKWLKVDVNYGFDIKSLAKNVLLDAEKIRDELSNEIWRHRALHLIGESVLEKASFSSLMRDNKSKSNLDLLLKLLDSEALHTNSGLDSQELFDLTYLASKWSTFPKAPILWNKILRNLGYDGIYDPGESVIHENEPHQACALSIKAIELVETFETKSIRKTTNLQARTVYGFGKILEKLKSSEEISNLWNKVKVYANEKEKQELFFKILLNKNTPSEIIEEIAKDVEYWDNMTIKHIAGHKNSTSNALLSLVLKENPFSSQTHNLPPYILKMIIENPKVTPEILEVISKNNLVAGLALSKLEEIRKESSL